MNAVPNLDVHQPQNLSGRFAGSSTAFQVGLEADQANVSQVHPSSDCIVKGHQMFSSSMPRGCKPTCLCCRREANRKASERLRQKKKARLVDLEGHCHELEAAKTMAQQQITSLLSVCQCVLRQNASLEQQLCHVLGGVQHGPAVGAAAAAQVATMVAQESALRATSNAMPPALHLPQGILPPAMGDMAQQLWGTQPAMVEGLLAGQPWAPGEENPSRPWLTP